MGALSPHSTMPIRAPSRRVLAVPESHIFTLNTARARTEPRVFTLDRGARSGARTQFLLFRGTYLPKLRWVSPVPVPRATDIDKVWSRGINIIQNQLIKIKAYSIYYLVLFSATWNSTGDSCQRTWGTEGVQWGLTDRREEDLPNETDACWAGESRKD